MPIPDQPPTVIRVSVLRCRPDQFQRFRQMMTDAEAVLAPGIQKMSGSRAYFAAADEATSSLSNVSVWGTLENGRSGRERRVAVSAHESDRDLESQPPDFARDVGAREIRHRAAITRRLGRPELAQQRRSALMAAGRRIRALILGLL